MTRLLLIVSTAMHLSMYLKICNFMSMCVLYVVFVSAVYCIYSYVCSMYAKMYLNLWIGDAQIIAKFL